MVKNQRKIYVENLGIKVKKLWKLKRKEVGKEIFEKKDKEFKGEWSRSRIWKRKKGDGEFG